MRADSCWNPLLTHVLVRCFRHGRSTLSNIVDVDFCAVKISPNHPKGVVVLFDLAAAFPSLSQEYVWQALSHVGLPPSLFEAVRLFYSNNPHYVEC